MKPLSSENYVVRPVSLYKTFTYRNIYLTAGNDERFSILEATQPPQDWLWSGSGEGINDSGIYKRPLYESLDHIFYQGSCSVWFYGTDLRPALEITSESVVYVLNIHNIVIGEGIKPSSVRISSPNSTSSLYDDGNGRILNENDEAIGDIFYNVGIITLPQSSFATASIVTGQGLYLDTGSIVDINYDSTQTIYEHIISCTAERGELNYSTNPSLIQFSSSSVSGSNKLIDQIASGTLTPYITTVGLYNSNNELLAVAKFPRPIKRAPDIDQTFIIRFDI